MLLHTVFCKYHAEARRGAKKVQNMVLLNPDRYIQLPRLLVIACLGRYLYKGRPCQGILQQGPDVVRKAHLKHRNGHLRLFGEAVYIRSVEHGSGRIGAFVAVEPRIILVFGHGEIVGCVAAVVRYLMIMLGEALLVHLREGLYGPRTVGTILRTKLFQQHLMGVGERAVVHCKALLGRCCAALTAHFKVQLVVSAHPFFACGQTDMHYVFAVLSQFNGSAQRFRVLSVDVVSAGIALDALLAQVAHGYGSPYRVARSHGPALRLYGRYLQILGRQRAIFYHNLGAKRTVEAFALGVILPRSVLSYPATVVCGQVIIIFVFAGQQNCLARFALCEAVAYGKVLSGGYGDGLRECHLVPAYSRRCQACAAQVVGCESRAHPAVHVCEPAVGGYAHPHLGDFHAGIVGQQTLGQYAGG